MSILSPLALVFGVLAVPVIVMYLLKMRRHERRVSSIFLWRQVIRDLEANAPWQKLRPNLLLFLQLLALAILVFSLARPVFYRDSNVRGDLILVLDASASMQAEDVAPTRFGEAQRKAAEMVNALPAGHVASVILMGDTPDVLVAQSSDKQQLRKALDDARPGAGGANLDAALSMAASLVQSGDSSEVVVLGDGNVDSVRPPESLPFTLRHELIGTGAGNLAVEAFSTRRTAGGLEGLARISNYGPESGSASLELYADDLLYDARPVEVPPGEDTVIWWPALPDAALFEVRLTPGDFFPMDDRAWTAGNAGSGAKALLVTAGNRFLEKALSLLPGLELTSAVPENYAAQGDYDIWIFDGFLPAELPEGALFALDPPVDSIAWANGVAGPVGGLRQGESDLLHYVDLSDMLIREAAPISPPPDAQRLLESSQGCLAAVWEEPHRRIAALAFDLHDSDLPLQPTFPIFVRNLTGWLAPGLGTGLDARPGDTVNVPVSPGAVEAWLEAPDGQRTPVAPPFPPQPLLIEQVGAYRIVQDMEDREIVNYLTVNLFRPAESDLAPAELPVITTQVAAVGDDRKVPYDLISWLALAALAVLILEWWVYERGY